MGLTIEMEPKADYLYVRIAGTFNMVEAFEGSLRVLNTCMEHQFTRVLMDHREAHGQVSIMDRWTYTQFMVSETSDRIISGKIPALHFAYVGDELVDPEKFGQTLARNRGMSLLVTTDLQEAFRWLGVQPENDRSSS